MTERPTTRADCPPKDADGRRRCPWISCRHHTWIDIYRAMRRNAPELAAHFDDPLIIKRPCSLDLAEEGGLTLEECGDVLGVSREYIRLVEARATSLIKRRHPNLIELIDAGGVIRCEPPTPTTSKATATASAKWEHQQYDGPPLREYRTAHAVKAKEIAPHLGVKRNRVRVIESGSVPVTNGRADQYKAAVDAISCAWMAYRQIASPVGTAKRVYKVIASTAMVRTSRLSVRDHGITHYDYRAVQSWRTSPPETIDANLLRALLVFATHHGISPRWLFSGAGPKITPSDASPQPQRPARHPRRSR